VEEREEDVDEWVRGMSKEELAKEYKAVLKKMGREKGTSRSGSDGGKAGVVNSGVGGASGGWGSGGVGNGGGGGGDGGGRGDKGGGGGDGWEDNHQGDGDGGSANMAW